MPRRGTGSLIKLLRDGMRFLITIFKIFKIGTPYAPLKIFVPTSLMFFGKMVEPEDASCNERA